MAIETANITNTAATVDMSILGLMAEADLIVKAVIVILFLSSFWSWAIIFDKLVRLRAVRVKTTKFERIFWSGQSLEQLYERVRDQADHPLAKVFVAAMHEWGRQSPKKGNKDTLHVGLKERIWQAMQVSSNRSMQHLEKSLVFLATVGSAAPFVGLFGTVWGIMNSFQSIAQSKNTTLVVVAPGIAEALLATAIGLFAAIPAVIFYNKFSNEIARYAGRMDDFCSELGSLLSRQLDGNSK